MKLSDPRLYESRNLQDFIFRLRFRDGEDFRRDAVREIAGLLDAGFVSPDRSRIWGPDISHWDGDVNFGPTVHAGAKFVIIKAMDGTVPTKYWAANNQRALDFGLLNSAYAWLYPDNRVSCVLQARAFYSLVKDVRLRLPPVVDFEWTRYAGVQANPNYSDLDKWVTEFTRLSGIKPILYSAAGYVNMFGRMPDSLRAKFAGFWWASYSSQPTLPMGFSSYDIWQFSAFGDAQLLCPGTTGKKELDLNYMTPAFYEKYGGKPPPPPEPTMEDKYFKVTASALNIRSSPENLGLQNDIGDLTNGDIVHAVEVVTAGGVTWHQIDPKVYRLGMWANLSITSPTGKYYAAEEGAGVWMVEVPNPTPAIALPDVIYIATKPDMSDKARYNKG